MSKRLIVYNIEYCEGMRGQWWSYLKFWNVLKAPKKLDDNIISSLKKFNPDILGLVEVDLGSVRAHKDEAKYFEKELGMNYIIEKVKYPFKSWTKLFYKIPILKYQGNALLSKYPIKNIKTHLFEKGTKKVVIEGTLEIPQKVTILLAHLALGKKTRGAQIKQLISIVNSIKNPVILMGDFNTFEGESEILNLLNETHLKHRVKLDSKSLTQPTFKPSRRLDYILTSSDIKVSNYETLNFQFSDHLPLMIDFNL